MENPKNKRSEDRVRVSLPVQLDNASGLIRDVSTSGICFEVDARYATGGEIDFIIEFDAYEKRMLLKSKGTIVRTEIQGKRTSVAVKITASVMEEVQ